MSNTNLCEDGTRETLRGFQRMMSATNTPGVLWDDGLKHCSAVRCHTINNIHEAQGEVPQTIITGEHTDMSWLAEFGWYTHAWCMSPEDTSMERKKLGKHCGPFFNEGDAMSAKMLTEKGEQLNRTSVFRATAEEARSEQFQKLTADFEASLKARLRKGYEPLYDKDEVFIGSNKGVVQWENSPTYDGAHTPARTCCNGRRRRGASCGSWDGSLTSISHSVVSGEASRKEIIGVGPKVVKLG